MEFRRRMDLLVEILIQFLWLKCCWAIRQVVDCEVLILKRLLVIKSVRHQLMQQATDRRRRMRDLCSRLQKIYAMMQKLIMLDDLLYLLYPKWLMTEVISLDDEGSHATSGSKKRSFDKINSWDKNLLWISEHAMT